MWWCANKTLYRDTDIWISYNFTSRGLFFPFFFPTFKNGKTSLVHAHKKTCSRQIWSIGNNLRSPKASGRVGNPYWGVMEASWRRNGVRGYAAQEDGPKAQCEQRHVCVKLMGKCIWNCCRREEWEMKGTGRQGRIEGIDFYALGVLGWHWGV